MTEIRLEPLPSNAEVLRQLRELQRRVGDMSPAMLAISETLQAQVERNFAAETAPDGTPWAPLKPATLEERARERYTGPILLRQRELLGSIEPDSGPDFAVVGTINAYAATHQFGRDFGRGSPIPERPFFGFGPGDEDEILRIVQRHLEGAAGR